jgi:hypothetical protein
MRRNLKLACSFPHGGLLNLPISLTVELLPRVSRQTSRNDTYSVTGGTIIPALLCCQAVVMKRGTTLAAGGVGGGGEVL